jgi:hypothetical protein
MPVAVVEARWVSRAPCRRMVDRRKLRPSIVSRLHCFISENRSDFSLKMVKIHFKDSPLSNKQHQIS